jgi:Arc/MetJ-type ribon-helix-helix transcriptional regulator
MKQKLSITIDEDKIEEIKKLIEEGKFRSKSHVLEYSLNKFLKEKNKE